MANETAAVATSKLAIMVRSAANLPADRWSDERIAAIRSTCCPEKATNSQFAIFLATAQKYDLDPITKEIWLVEDQGRIMVVTGRDTYVKVAGREKIYQGYQSGVVYANDEFGIEVAGQTVNVLHRIKSVFDRGARKGAYCVLFVEGRPPQVIVRTWDQFKHLHGKQNWSKYPDDMLETRCIVAALKRQFNLAGLEEEDVARDILAGRDPMLVEAGTAAGATSEMAAELRQRLGKGQPAPGPHSDGPGTIDLGVAEEETDAQRDARVQEEELEQLRVDDYDAYAAACERLGREPKERERQPGED